MSKDLFHAALQRAERDAELQRFTIGMQNFNERDAELQRAVIMQAKAQQGEWYAPRLAALQRALCSMAMCGM